METTKNIKCAIIFTFMEMSLQPKVNGECVDNVYVSFGMVVIKIDDRLLGLVDLDLEWLVGIILETWHGSG